MDDWRIRHQMALHDPQSPMERAQTQLMGAFEILADIIDGPDGFGTPLLGSMLDAAIGTLNYTLDRLDAGECDRFYRELGDRIGYDLDLLQVVWEDVK